MVGTHQNKEYPAIDDIRTLITTVITETNIVFINATIKSSLEKSVIKLSIKFRKEIPVIISPFRILTESLNEQMKIIKKGIRENKQDTIRINRSV